MVRRIVAAVIILFCPALLPAQSTDATVTGFITDQSKAAMVGVKVDVINVDTDIHFPSTTNTDGIYTVTNLPPGNYKIEVEKQGFKSIVKPDVVLHVQDAVAINFTMAVGSASESITVEGGAPLVDTESAAVSTVVDRQFIDTIPLNGRSLQPLITLTPGVVLTPASGANQGQFSVNGQRADANYFTVDGVSANFGASEGSIGQAAGGALPGLNSAGGTSSLVSIDAIQEFRVETSSYAPEFGRQPGGQISIATRSGTNQFHGDIFDYFRNTVLDANDWFNGAAHLPKAGEHQNDFGGVIGGPIARDRTFFFLSYEGLRLLLPATGEATVPTSAFRQSAPSTLQPLLNALPIPNGKDFGNGTAQFNASFSNPANLDAGSLRIDHKLSRKITLFGRYNYSPSTSVQRTNSLTTLVSSDFNTQTLTVGSTQLLTAIISNDFRFNYSSSKFSSLNTMDDFGGAIPPNSSIFASPFPASSSRFAFLIFGAGAFDLGGRSAQLQRQIALVDSALVSRGPHQLKFGVDYRRLTPRNEPFFYGQSLIFFGLMGPQGIDSGSVPLALVFNSEPVGLVFQNFSLYAQDAWKLTSRLTMTYGLRWEINPALHGADGTPTYTVQNLNDPPNISLAPLGTPFYNTTFHNFAPRIGLAAEISKKSGFEEVVRGGFGMFYDLGTGSIAGQSIFFPYLSQAFRSGNFPFPLSPSVATPPPISAAIPPGGISQLAAADPNLQLPRTYQWNLALEQSLGASQSLSVTYVGALGRDLLRQQEYVNPNPNFQSVFVTTNRAKSNYNALQIKYQRRLSHGLQALGFYAWSHCIDDASNDSDVFGNNPAIDRGNCDFDIRHSFHGVITYNIPTPQIGTFGKTILGGWSVDTIAAVQSAPPVDLSTSLTLSNPTENATVRPDVVPGIPLYLYGAQCAAANGGVACPGGKAINFIPGAVVGGCPDGSQSVGPFCNPPTDSNGNPLRQGNLGRNVLRGFGVTQIDLAVRRQFNFTERWNLQFSAEMFNVLNHPNFGSVDVNTADSPGTFGQATAMLNNSLGAGGLNPAGFNPLYQIGGPRSIQLALKLRF
jgi:hypothetical protein